MNNTHSKSTGAIEDLEKSTLLSKAMKQVPVIYFIKILWLGHFKILNENPNFW